MPIKNAKFMCSSQKLSQCPPAQIEGVEVLEVAFIGRSNVGKSSLINAITHTPDLAKVSSMPGKTQLINHFQIDNRWMLVDLPGYGYAKTSKSRRAEFGKLIDSYVLHRIELYCLFVVVDMRLLPQKPDVAYMKMLAENDVPFVIAFSKADKMSAAQQERALRDYKLAFSFEWEEFPKYFITSSKTGAGCEELVDYIEELVLEVDAENLRLAELANRINGGEVR